MALTNTFNTGTAHDGGCQGLSKRGPVPGQVDGETSVMYPFAREHYPRVSHQYLNRVNEFACGRCRQTWPILHAAVAEDGAVCRLLQMQYYLRATGTEELVAAPTLDIDG